MGRRSEEMLRSKDADPKRKLTDQEKLELRLFGVLPEAVVAEEVAVSRTLRTTPRMARMDPAPMM